MSSFTAIAKDALMSKHEDFGFCNANAVSVLEIQILRQRHKIEIECLQNELVLSRAENDIYKETVESLRNELVVVRAKLENEIFKNQCAVAQLASADVDQQSPQAVNYEQHDADSNSRIGLVKSITSKVVALSVGLAKLMNRVEGDCEQSDNLDNDDQFATWDVLNNVPGVVGFLCSSKDLQIKKASKKACGILGSSRLHEESFLSLLKSADSSASLKNAIDKIHQTPGSSPISLGCVEMATHSGRIDIALTAVKLPAKGQKCDPHVIIIGEKLQNAYFETMSQKNNRSRSRSAHKNLRQTTKLAPYLVGK